MMDMLRTRWALYRHRCWCCGVGPNRDTRIDNGYRSCWVCKSWGSEGCPRGKQCRGK